MSKKDYEVIAAAIHQQVIYAEENRSTAELGERNAAAQETADEYAKIVNVCQCERDLLFNLATDLCMKFADENPRFSDERFMRACGL